MSDETTTTVIDGTEYTQEEIAQAADLYPYTWVLQHQIKNEVGMPIDFDKRPWLKDIYNDLSPKQVWLKPPQIGATVCNTLKSLWVAKMLQRQIIYTLPTDGDVRDMVGGSFNRIIAQNPILLEWVKDHDTVEQKSVGNSMIFYRGTFTQKSAMMVPSGLNIHDEVDASDSNVITQYETRLQAQADGGWRWYFSHPSLAGHGVDVYWQQSDQKEWYITCNGCKSEHTLTWPESIDQIRGNYICKDCKRILTDAERISGAWKNCNGTPWNGNVDGDYQFSGWHVSQLMLHNKTAQDIIDAFNDPLKDQQYFYNYVLGLPFVGSDDRIDPTVVLRNCVDVVNPQENRTIIGVDTGTGLHYVLMNKDGVFYYDHKTDLGPTKSPYDEIRSLLKRFPRSIAVFDQGGELMLTRMLQQEFPGRVFLCFYNKDKKSLELVEWGENDEYWKVRVDRNRMMTLMVEQLRDIGRIRLNGTKEEWADFASHFGYIYRERIVVKAQKGKDDRSLYGAEYVWKRSGPDHYCIRNGAEVPTSKGVKKIEDIEIGDMVTTRKGYRRVEDAFMASANAVVRGVVLSNGSILWGTPDHKVFVADREWTTIDNLVVGDRLITWQKEFTEPFLTESNTVDTQTTRHVTNFITPLQVENLSEINDKPSTKRFGNFTMVQYQKVMLSTTLTAIRLITRLKIWLVLQEANITVYTPVSDGKTKSTEKGCLSSQETDLKTPSQKRKTTNNCKKNGVILNATNGVTHQKQRVTSVNGVNVYKNLTQKILCVLDVVLKLIQLLQEAVNIAPKNVEVITVLCDAQPQKVYDLTVEGEHEYFANGILVSNCHALLYAIVGLQRYGGDPATIVGDDIWAAAAKAQIVTPAGEVSIIGHVPPSEFTSDNKVF